MVNKTDSEKRLGEQIGNIARELREIASARFGNFKRTDPNRPVTSWIKKTRIITGYGYEFVVILRTVACYYASSPSGGCTMCGYYNDRGPEGITSANIINQFDYAVNKHLKKLKEIGERGEHVAVKIFTSGSYTDIRELPEDSALRIMGKAASLPGTVTAVIESRPELLTDTSPLSPEKLKEAAVEGYNSSDKPDRAEYPKEFILQIGIGVESTDDFIRNVLINKGYGTDTLKKAVAVCNSAGTIPKAYLLLKPPFMDEVGAVRDAVKSVKECIDMGFGVISLNPVNIQAYTVAELLYRSGKYRPPWIYSAIRVLYEGAKYARGRNVLFLCDPSAAGLPRGIHNCGDKECNSFWLEKLNGFVKTNDPSVIDPDKLPFDRCVCYNVYLSDPDGRTGFFV